MFSGQQHKPKATESQAAASTGKPKGFLNSPFAWLAIYLLALNIRFWFNFQAPHMNSYGACDASEYLRNAIALNSLPQLPAAIWHDAMTCLFGQANQATQDSVRTALAGLNELKISSPVFPTFLLAVFYLTGNTFDTSNWMLMLGAQLFLSALTCVIIAHTAYLVWDRKIGFAAGILSAIYPGFIVNSGRLYSETFAVFLMSLLVWLAIKDFVHTNKQGANQQNKFVWTLCQIFKGLTAIALQLTRSIMVVLTLALIPITVFTYWKSKKKTAIALVLMMLGYASIAMPWLALQKLAFGTSTLVVDRVGHYNFFTGNNAEIQGWLSVPYPDGRGIEKKTLLTLWQEEIKRSPSAWFRLMQDKLPRLLKFPWNDFRTPIGPFTVCQQITVHQIVLLLGAIGIMLSLFGNVLKRSNKVQLVCRLMLASLIAFQLVYCFFITVPRYNIAIMPFIAMFAAAGLLSLVRLFKNARSRKTAVSVAAITLAFFGMSRCNFSLVLIPPIFIILLKATLLFAFVIALWQATNWLDGSKKKTRALLIALTAITFVPLCLPVRAHGRMLEWQQTISNNSIRQTIELTANQLSNLQNRNCYLLIDADGQQELLNDASISVNGRHLPGPFIPSLSFVNDLSHVVPTGKDTVAFEQEYIFDCLTKEAATSNANLRQWFLLPIPRDILSSAKKQIKIKVTAKDKPLTLYGSAPSEKNLLKIPSLTRYSWEKAFYGVENTHGLTDTRYDQTVQAPEATARIFNIFLLADDVEDSKDQAISLVSKTSSGNDIELSLPEYDNEEIWLVRLKGEVRGNKSQAEAVIDIKCQNKNATITYQAPWGQRLIEVYNSGDTKTNWYKFDSIFPLKPSTLPGTALTLQGHFSPKSSLLAHEIGKQEPAPAEVRNLTAQVIHLPTMPINGNYKLYLGPTNK